MRKNLGSTDRLIRFVIACALLAASFFTPLAFGWKAVLFIVAAFQLASVATAY